MAKIRKEELEKGKTRAIIFLLSAFLGFMSYQFVGATLVESLVIGLYTSVLGLLIANRVTYEKAKDEILSRFETFGFVNKSLMEIEQARTQSNTARSTPILAYFGDSIGIWAQKLCQPGDSDQRDLWLDVLATYLLEEVKDLKADRLSTNVDIYVHLLMQTIRYHINSYGKDAVICILTSVLPKEWYNWPSKEAPERERVYEYREELVTCVQENKNDESKPELKRYIILSEANDFFKTKADLFQGDSKGFLKKYVSDLHFDPDNARYVCIEDIGILIPDDYKDLLFFGERTGTEVNWRWAIQSNMDPGFPVMFVKFHDAENLKAPLAFSKYDTDEFLKAIHRESKVVPVGENTACV